MWSAPATRAIDFSRTQTNPSTCHTQPLAGLGLHCCTAWPALEQLNHILCTRECRFSKYFLQRKVPMDPLDFLYFHYAFAIDSLLSYPPDHLFMCHTMSGSCMSTHSCLPTKLPKPLFKVYWIILLGNIPVYLNNWLRWLAQLPASIVK